MTRASGMAGVTLGVPACEATRMQSPTAIIRSSPSTSSQVTPSPAAMRRSTSSPAVEVASGLQTAPTSSEDGTSSTNSIVWMRRSIVATAVSGTVTE